MPKLTKMEELKDLLNFKNLEVEGITYQKASVYFERPKKGAPTMFNPVGKALDAPGERVFHKFEDIGLPRGRWYGGYMLYDPVEDTLTTWGNMAFVCPVRCGHHVGSTCPCCGLRG